MLHLRSTVPVSIARWPVGGLRERRVGVLRRWQEALARWRRRLRERDELGRLGDLERRDAGINAYDVAFERRKPFWRD